MKLHKDKKVVCSNRYLRRKKVHQELKMQGIRKDLLLKVIDKSQVYTL